MTPKPLRFLFDAMHHGRYSFDEFVRLNVHENCDRLSAHDRTIYRPSKTLKAFQSFLNAVVFGHMPVNERVSFAYRKGTSLRQAVEVHASGRAFYQADFVQFFHSIDSDLIHRNLVTTTTPVEDLLEHLDRIIEITTIQDRLPIGFVTSPTISNACLKNFDDSMEAACSARALTYSRYADDIVVSTSTRSALDQIDDLVLQLAREQIHPRFALNAAKRKLTRIGRRVQILGLDILPTGRITVSREVRQRAEYLTHFFVSNRERFIELSPNQDFDKGLTRLGGIISYINSADPEYLSKLRKKFGATLIDALLHRSFADESL